MTFGDRSLAPANPAIRKRLRTRPKIAEIEKKNFVFFIVSIFGGIAILAKVKAYDSKNRESIGYRLSYYLEHIKRLLDYGLKGWMRRSKS